MTGLHRSSSWGKGLRGKGSWVNLHMGQKYSLEIFCYILIIVLTLKYTSFSAYQINVRHTLLAKLIGTKTEEDESHDSVNRWVLVSSVSMLAFSLLEMVAYYLYNLKVGVVTYSYSLHCIDYFNILNTVKFTNFFKNFTVCYNSLFLF